MAQPNNPKYNFQRFLNKINPFGLEKDPIIPAIIVIVILYLIFKK